MKESKLLKVVVTSVAVFAFGFPAIAAAYDSSDLKRKSEKISYADLNVTKDADAQQLYRRLQKASKRVCGVESLQVARSIRAVSSAKRCYRSALDSAVAKVDNDTLSKIHEG